MLKRKIKLFLIILIVIVLLLSVLVLWQKDNLKALLLSRKMSAPEISESMETNVRKLSEQAEQISGVAIRPPTAEEAQALRDGTLSSEDLTSKLIGSEVPTADVQSTADVPSAVESAPEITPAALQEAVDPSVPASSVQEPDADREELARLISKIYVLQAYYIGWLEDAGQEAKEQFLALPKEERTAQAKFTIAMHYMELAQAKEAECDAEMAALEKDIRAQLKKLGESEALVDEIHAAYLEEKTLKKAYYLNQF